MNPITKKCLIISFSALLTVSAQSTFADTRQHQLQSIDPMLQLADADLPWVTGKVVKISEKRGVVTIAHEPISNLDMPSMTMGFKVKDAALLGELKAGDTIEMQVGSEEGKLVLLHYRRPNS